MTSRGNDEMNHDSRVTTKHDWRRACNYIDMIAPGCQNCRVAMDLQICRYAAQCHVSCPVAKGRFRRVHRLAMKKLGEKKMYLVGAVERMAIAEGQIAKLQVERAKLIKDGKGEGEVKALDREIKELAKLVSQYGRECGTSAHVGSSKDAAFDVGVFS